MQAEVSCITCKWLRDDLKCKAFPRGIPEKIRVGWVDHKEPFKGDNGIRFEPIDDEQDDN